MLTVIEESDNACDPDAVIELARLKDAVSISSEDGKEIFWIVSANEPRRVWDMTERALRSSLRQP
ncbi:MAG: hypothetical protein HY007_04225 [Candidatus Sungbacteria bacterium]|nr:hypothetical protein [Candidatus Sungbacteria bacterium]